MKKSFTVGLVLLMSLSLAACGKGTNQSSQTSSSSHSSKKVAHHHKKHKEATNSQASSSSQSTSAQSTTSSSVSSSSTSSAATSSSSSSQAASSQSSSTQASQASSTTGNRVNNAQEAVALAEATYGDNGGDYEWTYLTSGDSDQQPDGSYFVKAISKQQLAEGSMTGTAMSVSVYPDGHMVEY